MGIIKTSLGIAWENTVTGIELSRMFCTGIDPLQLGVVLIFLSNKNNIFLLGHTTKIILISKMKLKPARPITLYKSNGHH